GDCMLNPSIGRALSLPMAPRDDGALRFRCNSCGECCKRLRVALTHFDLAQLARALERPALSFIEWLCPDEVDLDVAGEVLVELDVGQRLMVLAHANGACHMLTSDNRCSAYAARPADCRAYPFVIERDLATNAVRLGWFEPERCGDETPDAVVDAAALEHA